LQSLSNQRHDFNVGMGPDVGNVPGGNNFGTRVFWTAVVPDRDVQVNLAAGTAQMHVRDLTALDYPEDFGTGSLGPNWQTAYVNATVSFDVLWTPPVTRHVTVNDATDQFTGSFDENHATVIWSAQSASGFRFESRAGNSMTSTPGTPNISTTYYFAQVGQEQNGIFFGASSTDTANRVQADAVLPHALVGWPANSASTPRALVTPPIVAGVAAITATSSQAVQAAPGPVQPLAGAAHARVIDQLFSDLSGGLAETL
jgi:hypothetical protein